MNTREMKMHLLHNLLFSLLLLNFYGCSSDGESDIKSEAEITVSTHSLRFSSLEEMQSIQVTSDKEFGVYSNQKWCKCTPSGGIKGENTIHISVTRNIQTTSREAVITIKSGKTLEEIKVTQEEMSGIVIPEGYELVWQDEFDDARLAGGKPALPKSSEWWYETGASGWGNNEIQNYIPGFVGADTCAVITDGTLKIIAKKSGSDVLSIRMNTSKSWTYGYFEGRLKLPPGKGTWPAFWMMPQNFTAWPEDGEIDIMEEVGYDPNVIHSSVHCKAYYHSIGTQKTGTIKVPTAQSEFHIYAVEWTPDYIKGFVDGKEYFTFSNDKTGNKDTWPFNVPFYLKLNLAWGGDWGGAQGIDESALPAVYEIDYVRVFQKK